MRIRSRQLAVVVLGVSFPVLPATPTLESSPIPGTKAFPESITSTTDGTLHVGRFGDGGLVRVKTRTAESTIFVQLSEGATTFEVFEQDCAFFPPQSGGAGLDGIAFGSDGNPYVTTYTAGKLARVEVKGGRARRITTLSGNHQLNFPDALRTLGNNSFLLIEGSGALDRVAIRGDAKFSPGLPIALLAAHSAFAQPAHVDVKPYQKVTDERLEHPDAGDWLMYRRTYDGSGYSPLNQITPSNIGRLTLAWAVSTDLLGAHETTAIVNHGRMFITTPQNNVIAFDAKTGTQLWRYARKYPDGLFQLHPTNRGVALYGDYVYMATTDCALVALDAATGKEVWNVALDDYKTGCYSTLAPLAVRGKIIVGYSGGELGVRGSVNAFDALTGKRIWKTYTVPAPNEPGGDTWKGETYKRGGGSTWITGAYDPASNTTYWGTGNPGPWVADDRPGDNLYTDSTLALDADTGKIKSYYQYTPHDSWDWDEVSAPLLIDTEVDGKLTKTATHAGRNGYLWILDRDRLKFLHAFPFANNNVFKSIDLKTGRPTVDESKRPGARQGAEFCPSIGGGKDWAPEAWSPQTKLLYIPANDNICAYLPKGEVPEADSKGFYVGYEVESIFGSVRTGPGASDHIGELQAWDLNTGKRVWQHNFKTMLWSPLLVTGGNILFAGGTPDRQFRAFDARSGKELWNFPLPSGAIGVPTSFAVDGEQYVAVTTGWDLDARGVQNGLDKIQGTNTAVPQAGTLLVFKLR